MKKVLLLIGVALTAMYSCSNDDTASTPSYDDNDESSVENVLIRLSAGGSTRASIESDEDGNFETANIAIFALADRVMDVTPSPLPISWAGDAEDTLTYAVLLNNVEAEAVKSSNGTDIYFSDGETYYYPHSNWYCYSFFGYHPMTEDIVKTDSQVLATIVIDGTQDIIYGRAKSDEDYAFSARYYRQSKNVGKLPELSFTHKLMRVTFSAKPGANTVGGSDYSAALSTTIESVKILSVPTTGELIVADLNTPDNDGTLTFDFSDASEKADFLLCDSGDVALNPDNYYMEIDGDGQPVEKTVGVGILLPVPESGYAYSLAVTLRDSDGNVYELKYPQAVTLGEGGTFEAGKSYNLCFTINGPSSVQLTAKLTGWVDSDIDLGGLTF